MTVSVLAGPKGNQRKELEQLVCDLKKLSPDIVNLPNLMFLGMAERLKASLGCKVVCTLSGEDIFLDRIPQPHRAQAFSLIAEAAGNVNAFISVTDYFARHARDHFQLPAERIHVVPMGIDVSAFSDANRKSSGPFTIGYFARICKEKGLAQLADVFVQMRLAGTDVRLNVGGFLGKSDKSYFDEVMRMLRTKGVLDSAKYIASPSLEDKVRFFKGVDVLCVPTVYREAKGFYVLEALAAGVPVVLPDHGSFPELVGRTGGGLLYEAGNQDDLQSKLTTLMSDQEMREDLAKRGLHGVARFHSTAHMADRTWALFEALFEALRDDTIASTASQ
ncbi:MAG: glycosyltransferase family 4 protein [Planctomycetes bacterium]|nr:glycosyltransferase family 4 protein [Planctomycetota bacterium]